MRIYLQDFYLDLVEDNRRITPRDYLELALRPVQGSGRDIAAKNEVLDGRLYFFCGLVNLFPLLFGVILSRSRKERKSYSCCTNHFRSCLLRGCLVQEGQSFTLENCLVVWSIV